MLHTLNHFLNQQCLHIDQLTRIMSLVGTPGPDLLKKITSDEARRYIMSLPQMRKKDFRRYFHGANPLGNFLLI
ncbi:hypothetical protein LSH36_367g04005 [Paralvinella palmiformis]|uniref:Uncharacterized protein n=1 Tax=Paralvinella palmiformis TaxID=53620 RepID=A0AAD9JDU9_9ANNE|nr:hypothetical protein LSH36_367g04005 [Paralvinella palmiformis]